MVQFEVPAVLAVPARLVATHVSCVFPPEPAVKVMVLPVVPLVMDPPAIVHPKVQPD
jgi:hypothetical protein